MIAHINGILISKSSTEAIIDCGGLGFQIFISLNTSNKLPIVGEKVFLNTLLIHKEDSMQLFGFLEKNEREMFVLLNSVSGIGPRSALGILSSITVSDLVYAISKENLLLLQKMPGIGKKTADRLIVELKDKAKKISSDAVTNIGFDSIAFDAIAALVSLGYNKNIAEKAVKNAISSKTDKQNISVEEIIRIALKDASK